MFVYKNFRYSVAMQNVRKLNFCMIGIMQIYCEILMIGIFS